MYQPYIRGKQFELISINELVNAGALSCNDKISLIIEPVKNSSTLRKTLKNLASNHINFTLIVNPQIGSFKDINAIFELARNSVGNYKNYQIGIILHTQFEYERAIEYLLTQSNHIPALSLIHNAEFDHIKDIIEKFKEHFLIKYNIINLVHICKKYFRNFDAQSRIQLDDHFIAKSRNADYLLVDESRFSEEHLYYQEEGYIGFSDFLTVGEDFSESGFLPYAVAIHISYADVDTRKIKVKHFVSDSNDDTSDIAGKFAEALDKLISWSTATGYESVAMPEFIRFYETGHFPGLGTLKKLSIMNHIDLVLKLI